MGSNFDKFFFQFRFSPVGLEKHKGIKVVISGSIESYEKYAAFLLRKTRQAIKGVFKQRTLSGSVGTFPSRALDFPKYGQNHRLRCNLTGHSRPSRDRELDIVYIRDLDCLRRGLGKPLLKNAKGHFQLSSVYCTKAFEKAHEKTKLNARLAIRQRADLFEANILANKISLPWDQCYTEREI